MLARLSEVVERRGGEGVEGLSSEVGDDALVGLGGEGGVGGEGRDDALEEWQGLVGAQQAGVEQDVVGVDVGADAQAGQLCTRTIS